jgi:rhodanese-related sulfurtransferase
MNLITKDELRRKLERGDDFKLVMTLHRHAFQAKRIPTSLHFETVGEALTALDPADEIVVYCSNAYCASSIYAYRVLERQGYGRLRRYPGGVDEWEEAGLPVESGPADREAARPRRTRHRPRAAARTPRWSGRRPWPVHA